MTLACPSCGFFTIKDETYGSYQVCEICGWEDDMVQLANPCSGRGANYASLYKNQSQSVEFLPLNIKKHKGINRSEKWRPLNNKEVERYKAELNEKHWFNKGITYEEDAYWNKNS